MTYPKIYSISTVGIIKHYNHDYLLHDERTDFVGPNGAGKSILADLLQMMFVFDREIIKFGTVDVKGERHIHTLPYKTRCAYCFINIAVSSSSFITVGIQIRDIINKRIIPFIITRETDLSLDITGLSVSKEHILFAKDFIVDDVIPDIQGLAAQLNERLNLKLQFFKNKEEVQRYYQFLFEKNILPINLAQEKNLKAYAKVIQSFSKAQSLKLGGDNASKNLKDFLFEDSNEEMLSNFEAEKFELEKVLREYNRLNSDIKMLAEKQSKLMHLSRLEINYKNAFKQFKRAELNNSYLVLQSIAEKERGLGVLKDEKEGELLQLQSVLNRLPILQKKAQKNYDVAESNFNAAAKYHILAEEEESLEREIAALRMVILPEIDNSWQYEKKADISTRSVAQIKDEVLYAGPYLKAYGTLQNIEAQRKSQLDEIDRLKAGCQAERLQAEKLLGLLQSKGDGSFLHWYFKHQPALATLPLQAVLHFAALPVSKISEPKNKERFIEPAGTGDFIIEQAGNGIWLKSGALCEFIAHNPDADLLSGTQALADSVQQLAGKLVSDIAGITAKLRALALIVDGQAYDTTLFTAFFDPSISERASIERLKSAVSCMLQRDAKLAQLQQEKAAREQEMAGMRQRFGSRYHEPEVLARELKKQKQICTGHIQKAAGCLGGKKAMLTSLQKELAVTKQMAVEAAAESARQQALHNELLTRYFHLFQENVSSFSMEKQDAQLCEEDYRQQLAAYRRFYTDAAARFEETKEGGSAEVKFELDNDSYSFSVLERALLGNRIKTTDDITAALQDANDARTQIAEGIRDNMLKIFSRIATRYNAYKTQVLDINAFFLHRKISDKFYFTIKFEDNSDISIHYINELAYEVRLAAIKGELQFDRPIGEFLEDFFKRMAGLKDRVPIAKLLDPRTYFELSAKLLDQFGSEVPGSTGESYAAMALLGIARLSAQKAKVQGLRFIILEELGSIDKSNFNIFPAVAKEFQYQIITMAPHVFNIGLADEWYAHHLIPGKSDSNINYWPSASYFKSKQHAEALNDYLLKLTNELD